MPNVMAAQPNVGGALCKRSVIPFQKVWPTPAAGVPCSNAANIGEGKTWTQSEFCIWQNSVRGKSRRKCIIQCSSPGDGQTSCKVWLASGVQRRCSNEAKTRSPLKFAGVPQTVKLNRSQPLMGRVSPYCEDMWRRYCRNEVFFPTVDTCLICEDIARRICVMVRRWRFLAQFLRSVFSASCEQHILDMHSE